jgi:endonuclease G, mitochondrial
MLKEHLPSFAHLPARLRTPALQEQLEGLYNHGNNYMLDVNFLIAGARVAGSVCRIEIERKGQGDGTGFLVSPNLVLTNYHVIFPSAYDDLPKRRASAAGVRFGAITDKQGGISAGHYCKLHPTEWEVDKSVPADLDYILLRLDKNVTDEYSIKPLYLEARFIQKGAFVNIIHHPHGGSMAVSLRYNQVVAVEDQRIYYLTDTTRGSSGAPVCDDKWNVVGLHRSGGEYDIEGNLRVEANAGVPIEAILEKIAPYLHC